jgi:hypothetical protein
LRPPLVVTAFGTSRCPLPLMPGCGCQQATERTITRPGQKPTTFERDAVLASVKTTPLCGWRWRAKS